MTVEPTGGQWVVNEGYKMLSICIGERRKVWGRVLLAN
jgi:hypothetical protein